MTPSTLTRPLVGVALSFEVEAADPENSAPWFEARRVCGGDGLLAPEVVHTDSFFLSGKCFETFLLMLPIFVSLDRAAALLKLFCITALTSKALLVETDHFLPITVVGAAGRALLQECIKYHVGKKFL